MFVKHSDNYEKSANKQGNIFSQLLDTLIIMIFVQINIKIFIHNCIEQTWKHFPIVVSNNYEFYVEILIHSCMFPRLTTMVFVLVQ